MVKQENRVSWDAALYIWWGEVWRVAATDIAIAIIVMITSRYTPVVHKALFELMTNYEGTSLVMLLALQLYIHMWAVRQSFTNRYPTFIFAAENKTTTQSVFSFDKRLGWSIVLPVWWAQVWRMLLIPAAVIGGGLAATLAKHPGAANYVHLLNTNLTKLNLYAAFVLSIWATKESLGDKYKTFRFVSTPRTFYDAAGR
jgi:hypothetical protein